MLAEIYPWAAYRETYGQAIERRELIRCRVGRIGGHDRYLATHSAAWCSELLDQGYRGEMNASLPRIWLVNCKKDSGDRVVHGKRMADARFMQGHLSATTVHDCSTRLFITEGEGEMLGMACFKSDGQTSWQEVF